MIKHIVLFKMRDDIAAAEKEVELKVIKAGLEALLGIAPTLRSIEVGINCNPAEKFDLSLIATFDNLDDLNAYAVHPDHVAVSKRIRAILDVRACNDFEF
ncbi:MAG: Dabb family protein [Bacteroidales bacterium]|nr:Dabb family protein [Bacteroidales bacterium]